jgi:hypothetical protein
MKETSCCLSSLPFLWDFGVLKRGVGRAVGIGWALQLASTNAPSHTAISKPMKDIGIVFLELIGVDCGRLSGGIAVFAKYGSLLR